MTVKLATLARLGSDVRPVFSHAREVFACLAWSQDQTKHESWPPNLPKKMCTMISRLSKPRLWIVADTDAVLALCIIHSLVCLWNWTSSMFRTTHLGNKEWSSPLDDARLTPHPSRKDPLKGHSWALFIQFVWQLTKGLQLTTKWMTNQSNLQCQLERSFNFFPFSFDFFCFLMLLFALWRFHICFQAQQMFPHSNPLTESENDDDTINLQNCSVLNNKHLYLGPSVFLICLFFHRPCCEGEAMCATS